MSAVLDAAHAATYHAEHAQAEAGDAADRAFDATYRPRTLLDMLAADPNVAQDFRAAIATPDQAAQLARADYRAKCEKWGRRYDPIQADEEATRARRKAQGIPYYSGD